MIFRWFLKELGLGLVSLGIAREGGGVPIHEASQYRSSDLESE